VIDSSLLGLADHLWQSTLFAVMVGCLTLLLRKNSARDRYLLWLAASAKFLVPFALLTAVGTRIPWPFGQVQATHVISTASQMAAQFTQFDGPRATALVAHADSAAVLPIVLGALWILGTLAILARALARWALVRRALHESTPMSQAFIIPVRLSASQLEPAVVGILRPVLVLPEGLDLRLSPEEISAVLAHERCHVAWKDNLAAAVHMLVEALFWFHPLIWWLGARLVDERERACDEQVLADGHAPASYAEGILKVCEHYLESRLLCVAGAGGANLRQRIQVIMKSPLIERMGPVRKLVLTMTAGAAIITPVLVGVLTSPHARAQAATPGSQEPNVSIELWREDGTNTHAVASSLDRWVLEFHATLRSLIASAYGVSESQVVGWDWSKDRIYQITADGPPSLLKPGNTMMRDVLAKHFGLVVKVDRKLLKGYALRTGAGGSKLTPSSSDPGAGSFSPNGVEMSHFPVSSLITFLQTNDELRAPVVDQTGLEGNYDYKVSWESPAPGAPTDPAAVAKALDEQLGLHLEAKPVNVDVISVVSVKSPAEVVTADMHLINFNNAEIGQVIAAVQMATHKTFVVDPRVHARVTYYSSTPISSAAFYRAFLNILRENHYVAVATGDIIQIMPETSLRSRAPN
jgi:bla regulator protein BlaR1